MAISVNLFALDGIAYSSADVQFGEAETLSPPVNTGSVILTVPLRRRRLTLNARGVTEAKFTSVDSQRTSSVSAILGGTPSGSEIEVGAFTIENALLLDYQPGAPITIESVVLLESVSLIYDSMSWS